MKTIMLIILLAKGVPVGVHDITFDNMRACLMAKDWVDGSTSRNDVRMFCLNKFVGATGND